MVRQESGVIFKQQKKQSRRQIPLEIEEFQSSKTVSNFTEKEGKTSLARRSKAIASEVEIECLVAVSLTLRYRRSKDGES